MLKFYKMLMSAGEPLLTSFLDKRIKRGKELEKRLDERKGISSKKRGLGPLVWVHAASVGEAQSALILMDTLLKVHSGLHILVTTGTVTSAQMMEKKLPKGAFHQFYPVDHPQWVSRFLDHWTPDLVLWMESEIWPNMLMEIQGRKIPAALVNARLSERSYKRWKLVKGTARKLLRTFDLIVTQTQKDAEHFEALGAVDVMVSGNLKYSAKSLAADEDKLKALSVYTTGRPIWLYASTHKGEEAMACRIHQVLKNSIPDVLSILVPRHPDRGAEIKTTCSEYRLSSVLRSESKLPGQNTDIYIADTLGELGLFYRLTPIACIGRSFSDDGGGGHNPIEAAQLNCAVLHGPHVQHLQEIFDEMDVAHAALRLDDEKDFAEKLLLLLEHSAELQKYQASALDFAKSKEQVIQHVALALEPLLQRAGIGDNENEARQA